MCCDWQIDWPTDCGCGTTWQVEIGKWEAHFSLPSAEQKIKAFSSTEAIGRGGAQIVQVLEWLPLSVHVGLRWNGGRVSTIYDKWD